MCSNQKKYFTALICVIIVVTLTFITPAFAGTTNNPAITVAVSQPTVSTGDSLLISGTATGNPGLGVQMWILCKNYVNLVTVQPDSAGTYKYELDGAMIDTSINRGVCNVVVQHPMGNNQFDIYVKNLTNKYAIDYGVVYNRLLDTRTYKQFGASSLHGSDSRDALVESISDSTIDDAYAETQFTVVDLAATTVPISTTATKYTNLIGTINPQGDLVSGTPTSATFQIDYNDVFPPKDTLQFSTDLEKPKWTYSLFLDNVENPREPVGGNTLTITGFEISYPVKETINVTLVGTAPFVQSSKQVKVLQVQQVSEQNIFEIYNKQTIVKGSVTTTSSTSSPTTNPTTTISTTQITPNPTTSTTISPTSLATTPPTSVVTTISTNNIEKLLEEQNKKIDEQNKLIAEQNKKIEEQSDVLSQLLSYLKGIFGWQ